MPNYVITDGTKAVPLSALPADAWSPIDPEETGGAGARSLRSTVPVLARCLDVRGKSVASAPVRLERRGVDVADTPEGRAILDTLRGLMYRSEVGLCFAAAAYWEMATNRVGRNLTPFWCATGTIQEVRDPATGDPTFYRVAVSNGRRTGVIPSPMIAPIYLPSDAVDIGPDLRVAPILAAAAKAGTLKALDAYTAGFFARGGVPITLLQVDKSLPAAERAKLKSWWDQAVRGVRAAFASLVVSNSIEPKVIGSHPRDTAAPDLQKSADEGVAVAMGVPMSMLYSSALAGGTADAESANFWENTIFPEVNLILPVANHYWLSPLSYEVIADYDRHPVRQWAFAQRADAMIKLTANAAVLTVDEARARMGMPPMGGSTPPEEGAPLTPETDPSKGVRGYHIEQGVVSRNEAQARMGLPPDNDTQSERLRALQAQLAVVKAATDAGFDLAAAQKLVGMSPVEAPPTPPPLAPVDETKHAVDPMPTKSALTLWRNKAQRRVKQGRSAAVAFASDDLDPEDAALIRDRLSHATTPDAIKAAFVVPPPGEDLSASERAVYDALRPVFAQYGPKAVEAVLDGIAWDSVQMTADIQAALASALMPLAVGTMVDMSTSLGVAMDSATAATFGAAYIRDSVGRQIEGITETTLKAVQASQDVYRATPGMTREQVEQLLQPTFSPRRAESIAITETTNANSAATSYTQSYLGDNGIMTARRWNTNNDEKTCAICGPLNRQLESAWAAQYPDGPAGHPRCRCWITLVPLDENGEPL